MARYFVSKQGGYIQGVYEGTAGENEITRAAYEAVIAAVQAMPEAPAGKGYRLKEDLSYEAYDLPENEEQKSDIAEAIGILTGEEAEENGADE